MDEHVGALCLDPAAQVGQGHMQLLATLTDRRLLFASVGFVSVKPKQLVVEVPIESVRLEWWDRTEVGPDHRWLLFLMGERWLRHSSVIDKNSNTDEFVATLGERAVRVR
jgi:hypothetical protein